MASMNSLAILRSQSVEAQAQLRNPFAQYAAAQQQAAQQGAVAGAQSPLSDTYTREEMRVIVKKARQCFAEEFMKSLADTLEKCRAPSDSQVEIMNMMNDKLKAE